MADLASVYKEIKDLFRVNGIDDDPGRFISEILHFKIEDIFLNHSVQMTNDQHLSLDRAVKKRITGMPLSRIIGKRSFWRDEFHVSPETLDPRADSETIIEAVLKHGKEPRRILDLGTATGCLLLSLLREYPDAVGLGLDILPGAVATAQRNAHDLGFSTRSRFMNESWDKYDFKEKFDVIVSNPPYIKSDVIKTLDKGVKDFDPPAALDGGADGLDAYRSLAALIPRILAPRGVVVLEIGYDQALSVPPLFEAKGLTLIDLRRDLGGNPRALVMQVAEKT
jgi:release factor glutamine methyltransferase